MRAPGRRARAAIVCVAAAAALLLAACLVGCTAARCHPAPLVMHWTDGTATIWAVVVCDVRR